MFIWECIQTSLLIEMCNKLLKSVKAMLCRGRVSIFPFQVSPLRGTLWVCVPPATSLSWLYSFSLLSCVQRASQGGERELYALTSCLLNLRVWYPCSSGTLTIPSGEVGLPWSFSGAFLPESIVPSSMHIILLQTLLQHLFTPPG